MTNFKNEQWPASHRWQIVLGVVSSLLLGACAEETSAPQADHAVLVTARIIHNQTGEVREVTGMVDMSALEAATDDTAAEKAGCTHIRACTTTFITSNDVLCDTNDKVCSSGSRFSECKSDASFVCGRTRPLGFDPPIPCPIAGLSVSICPADSSLVWINGNQAITL
jgi:hypothetical protein